MQIIPVIRFNLQFDINELNRHIALLQLGRSQLNGKAHEEASKMIEELEAVVAKYEAVR